MSKDEKASRPLILVADDAPLNLRLMTGLLEQRGYAVVQARSGPETIAQVEAHKPDLLLLDALMPEMDGIEVALALKAREDTARLPIIMVTISAERTLRARALEAGVEDFLSKPVDREELQLRVRNHLRIKQLADELEQRNRTLERRLVEKEAAEAARHKLQTQLQQARRMEALGRLAGGVAHDFNNLLTVILTSTQLLLMEEDELNTQQITDLGSIREAAERAASLTQQLLSFSRDHAQTNERAGADSVLARLEPLLKAMLGESIELNMDLEETPSTVGISAARLEQLLVNLAVNAHDAMNEGGQLHIQTRHVQMLGLPTDPGALPAGQYVRLRVSDTGTGIPEDVQQHIFEPFFTTKDEGEGTGLGLSIVYGIVQQAKGDIKVESVGKEGTCFTIHLPIFETTTDPTEPEPEPKDPGGTETILLVEDGDMVRTLCRRALEGAGYHVLVACSAQQALGISSDYQGAIDLLLTDVIMPRMGGGELSRALAHTRPQTKVLFMSGYNTDAIVKQGISSRTAALISKPFTLESLRRKVRQILDTCSQEPDCPGKP